jgi:O-antigen/teichoic acid export membrane protein
MLRTAIARLKKSEVVRGAAVIASGTAAAQIVVLAAAPILTRLFTPEQYGILGVVVSIATLLAVAGTLCYNQAILLERDDVRASHLVVIVIYWSVLLSLAVCAGEMAIGSAFTLVSAADVHGPWTGLLMLVMAVQLVLWMWAIHRKRYGNIAIADALAVIAIVAIQLVAGALDVGVVGLLGGQVAGTALALIVLGVPACRSGAFASLRDIDLRTKWALAKKHYRFPLYAMPAALLECSSKRLPIFLLALFFSPVEAGYYWLCHRLMASPVRLVVRSSRKPYYKQALDLHARGESITPLLWKSTGALAAFAISLVMAMFLFGPFLFEVVFGAEWQRAGHYAQWVAVATAASVLSMPCLELAPIYHRQGQVLAFQVVQALARTVAISIGGFLADDLLAIALFAIASCVMSAAIIGYFWRLIGTISEPGTAQTSLSLGHD